MKQTLKYIYSVLNENVKFAEGKHSVLIALNSALIVFISGYLKGEVILIKLITCLVIITSMFSIFFNFVALLSRKVKYVKNLKYKENELNLIYYKHIINFSYDEFLKVVKQKYDFPDDYKFDGLDYDLSKQIIATSNVINLKFTFFNYSLVCLFIALILTILNVTLVGLL